MESNQTIVSVEDHSEENSNEMTSLTAAVENVTLAEDTIPVEDTTSVEDIFNEVDPEAHITGVGEKYRINFKNRTPAQIEFCASYIIDVVLRLAHKHNGKVFGGFVRDILIPLNFNTPLAECNNFKDVDLWFTTLEDAKAFNEEKEIELFVQDLTDETYSPSDDAIYEFKVSHGIILKDKEPISFIDIIIAPELPVNDFDINRLVSWGFVGDEIRSNKMKPMSDEKLWTLLDNGRDKVVNMLPEYRAKIERWNYYSGIVLNRIKTRYLDRGWKVMIDGKEFKSEYIDLGPNLEKNRSWYRTAWNNFLEAE